MAIFLYVLPKGENEEIKVLPSVVLSSLKFESIFVDFIPLLTLYLFFFLLDKILPNLFEGRISTAGLMWKNEDEQCRSCIIVYR